MNIVVEQAIMLSPMSDFTTIGNTSFYCEVTVKTFKIRKCASEMAEENKHSKSNSSGMIRLKRSCYCLLCHMVFVYHRQPACLGAAMSRIAGGIIRVNPTRWWSNSQKRKMILMNGTDGHVRCQTNVRRLKS